MRRNRASIVGITYFVTICTSRRETGLRSPDIVGAIKQETQGIEADQHWQIRAVVIMPDHVHLLFTITGSLNLSQLLARLKAKTRNVLAQHALGWQQNFHDHRMRTGESLKQVVRYVAQNPVRKALAAHPKDYDAWWLGTEEQMWFDEWEVSTVETRPPWLHPPPEP